MQQHNIVVSRGRRIVYMAQHIVIGLLGSSSAYKVHSIGVDKGAVSRVVHRKTNDNRAKAEVVLTIKLRIVGILLQPILLILDRSTTILEQALLKVEHLAAIALTIVVIGNLGKCSKVCGINLVGTKIGSLSQIILARYLVSLGQSQVIFNTIRALLAQSFTLLDSSLILVSIKQ